MPQLTLHLFGAPRLAVDGAPVQIERRKAVACAVYLAVTGQEVSRELLATLFWPEIDAGHARADLRRILHVLSHTLGAAQLVLRQDRVQLPHSADLWLDVAHFGALLSTCHHHGHPPEAVCTECLPLLATATALYRDDFLTGFSLPDAPEFDRWQWLQSEHLRGELAAGLSKLVRGHTALGEYAHATAYARRWVALDPLDETAQRRLMQVYAWAGDRSAALQQFQLCRQTLAQELNASPEPATQELEASIRHGHLAPPTAEELGVVASRPGRTTQPLPPPAAEDELRLVTVLSAGIALREDAGDIDAAAAQTEQFLALADSACAAYGGHVARVPGGDMVAIFGLDRTHEDDPERAVRAALELQHAAELQAMPVQIGINTGMAYCMHAATASHVEAQLTGNVVNLAVRLRSHAAGGEILAGSATYAQTQGLCVCAPRVLALPGLARPVTAYQIQRLHGRATKGRGVAGLQAPLIGRTPEMAQLESAMHRALAGEGQVVLISGAAGVGKSRLVAELKQRWLAQHDAQQQSTTAPAGDAARAPVWLEGRCSELASTTIYWPFLDMLRAALSPTDDDDDAVRARRLVAMVHTLAAQGALTAEQADAVGPLLGKLLSLQLDAGWDARMRQVAPKQMQQRTFDAVCTFITALVHSAPRALVFEDLHWADLLSLELIGHLFELLDAAPLLLICVYRPELAQTGEPLHALAQRRCPARYTLLHLHELNLAESRELLASLLALEELPEQLRDQLLAKAQGNPFFLEEIVRAQIGSGLIFQQAGSWRAQVTDAALDAPESVQSVILSRVDRLSPAQADLLQLAAVAGQFCPRRLLATVASPELDLESALAALSAAAFIHQTRPTPEAEYAFRHVLVQDAIYQALPGKRRARLHRRVAERLEALYAANLRAYVEQIAYHYDHGDVTEKAIEYLVRAGDKAQQAYSVQEAVACYTRALARLDIIAPPQSRCSPTPPSAPACNEGEQWRLAALRGLGIVYWSSSDLAAAEDCFHRAIAQARSSCAPALEVTQLYGWLCRLLRWQNRFDDLIFVGQEGLAQLHDDAHPLEAGIFYSNLVEAYFLTEERARYHATLQQLTLLLKGLPFSDDLFAAYGHLVIWHRDRNEIDEAAAWLRLVEEGLADGHDPLLTAWMHMWQASRYLDAIGDIQTAIARNELGLAQCRKLGDAKTAAWGLSHLAVRYLSAGNLAQAQELAEESLALQRAFRLEAESTESIFVLALIKFCQGDCSSALDLAESALAMAERTGLRYALGVQRTLLGFLHLALGQPATAATHFDRVLATQSVDAQRAVDLFRALAGLELAVGQDAFLATCRDLQDQRPELAALGLQQWWLAPTTLDPALPCDELTQDGVTSQWTWHDPRGDCSCAHGDCLTIGAANGRTLWANNLSAPRLLRPVASDGALQVACSAARPDQPAIGGILLWLDKANFLRLTWGELGAAYVAFAGALDNRSVVIGRGVLMNPGQVYLRLERCGEIVRALCSADGQSWRSVGAASFSAHAPLQIGLHAIGEIDRITWPGAFPAGTAIRFVV